MSIDRDFPLKCLTMNALEDAGRAAIGLKFRMKNAECRRGNAEPSNGGLHLADWRLGSFKRPHPQPLSHPMGEGGAWPGFSSPEDRSPRRVRNAEWRMEMEENVLRDG